MSAPETLRTFDGAEFELRATTRTGTALYAIKGAPKCCPPQLMATLAELAEHGIQSTELAAAVAKLGTLPMPAGNAPRASSAEQLAVRVAELEKVGAEARAALGALCYDLEDPGSNALGALYLLQQTTPWSDAKPDDAVLALARHDAATVRRAAEFVRDTYSGAWADDAANTLEDDANRIERGETW
jgi:hypothetical protein